MQKRSQFLLYPEVVMDVKRQKGAVELWPSDSQIWLITKVDFSFYIIISVIKL